MTYSIISLLVRTDLGDARVPAFVLGGFSVVIGVFWGRWWHAGQSLPRLIALYDP